MEPDQLIESVIAKLDYLKDLPVDEFETGLDEVNLKMVNLRDRLIILVRSGQSSRQTVNFLKQINLALSIIFGLAYPLTGFQRAKIEQATAVLKTVPPAAAAA